MHFAAGHVKRVTRIGRPGDDGRAGSMLAALTMTKAREFLGARYFDAHLAAEAPAGYASH